MAIHGALVMLEIDASELNAEINRIRNIMSPEDFNTVLFRTFDDTGKKVKTILKRDLPHAYHIKPGEVGAAVKNARINGYAGSVGCVIPVTAGRRSIGPGGFTASGGSHGWNSRNGKYHVKSRIVKARISTLPDSMKSYGGQPPFRNLSAKRLNGLAFTRAGKEKLPIEKIVGIAIPQMPINRSEAEVQSDILQHMKERMEHHIMFVLGGG